MGLLEPITHKEEIEHLLMEAKEKYTTAEEKLEKQRKRTFKRLKKLGKIKINAWAQDMKMFLNVYETFQYFDAVQNPVWVSQYSQQKEEPQKVLVNMKDAVLTASDVTKIGAAAIGAGTLVGFASYGGAMMFGHSSTGAAIANLHGAAQRNATLAWFGGGSKAVGGSGIAGGKMMIAGVVIAPIVAVAAILTGKKGKEKLAEARETHNEAIDAACKMDIIRESMLEMEKISRGYIKAIDKIRKPLKQYTQELIRVKEKYVQQGVIKIDCATLTKCEQGVLQIAWEFAQIYHRLLSTPIMTENGGVVHNAEQMLLLSIAENKQIEKSTLRMKGDEAKIGDVLWRTKAVKALVSNFALMSFLLVASIFILGNNVLLGFLYLLAVVIACPIFFYYRNLSQGRLFIWRRIRMFAAIAFVVVLTILIVL